MSTRLGAKLAGGSLALSVGLSLAAVYLVLTLPASVPAAERPANTDFTYTLLALAFAVLGAFLASRRDGNRVAWMACVIGLGISLAGFAAVYDLAAQYGPAGGYPFRQLFLTAGNVGWDVGLGITVSFLPLLFPDGRLLSRRWRPVAWLAGIGIALLALGDSLPRIPGAGGIGGAILSVAIFALLAVTLAIIASLILRYRRAGPGERLQLKWFMTAAIVLGVALALQVVLQVLGVTVPGLDIAYSIVLLGLPVSIAIAVLKYRLYEIDVVINRALVYGSLAVFITAVYVGIVVGIGTLIGSGGRTNLALSIVATALVAVAFQRVRERVQRLANRLVYGKRATPYEVMADFSERMAGTLSPQEVLPRMAEAAARGVGAEAARVSLTFPDGSQRAVWWPRDAGAGSLAHRLPVEYRDERVGEIAVSKAAGDRVNPAEAKLLWDLAAQAGLVLHNLRLTAELQARVEEISAQARAIRASRQRLVTAADAERQRLEQTIRRGVEQQLAGLAVRLRAVDPELDREPLDAARLLDELTMDLQRTLESLRALAHGIYPPLLRDQGLAAALRSQLARQFASVQIGTDGLGRYPSEVEAAIYFCCIEGLSVAGQDAALRLREQNDVLEFSVSGALGEQSSHLQDMEDRIQAIGGSLTVDHNLVTGRVPIRVPELVV